jgi:hypothetical protein
VLRTISLVTAAHVIVTTHYAAELQRWGDLTDLVHDGALGALTASWFLLTILAGPVAVVQLWRLKKSGLFAGWTVLGFGAAWYGVFLVVVKAKHIVGGLAVFRPAAIVLVGLAGLLWAWWTERRSVHRPD